ncbi:hypothetical protein LTR84_009404 [Exophiala bonariae]|uniref:Nucleoside phosphorylase domain-containing protein n=1 Tax=Exophiala bonariae TaxID=1690606 RepID=A0AAV9MUH3_9EURO|nr:hypothetical protein LTR84_009404 [Exophiala bonariae]
MPQNNTQPRSRDGFEIAIICALRTESDAVEALFDQFWEEEVEYDKVRGDSNSYTLGRIGRHNVVLAYMPGMGKAASATVAGSFRASFPSIRLALIVGVCGGVPRDKAMNSDILLGDVIISTGVVQFDFGRQLPDQVAPKDTLDDSMGRPNSEIRAFLHKIQGWHGRTEMGSSIVDNIAEILTKPGFESWSYPGTQYDALFPAAYRHKHHTPNECMVCDKCVDDTYPVCQGALLSECSLLQCDLKNAELRAQNGGSQIDPQSGERQITRSPLHYGLVASGDLVMRSAKRRNELATLQNVIGFEMEGCGAWDTFPTVIIKGVCDYADSHKNKKWQKYAAVTAAAASQAFLRRWRGVERPVDKNADSLEQQQQKDAPLSIRQAGSEFHGPTVVSGGMVFQGNYAGR